MIRTMVFDAEVENLYPILDVVDEELSGINPDPTLLADIHICVEEIFVNIASYAYGDTIGQVAMELEVTESTFRMLFRDSGRPYNPLEKDAPDITLTAAERGIGGLGILMIKEMMDTVTYEYKENQNWLSITKNIRQKK